MIKKKYIISTILLSLICMNKTYAICTEQALEEFKEIENQYKITTNFNSEDKTYNMIIERGNPQKYDYVFTIDYGYQCTATSKTKLECTGLKPGTSFYASIIGKTKECNELVKEEEIRLKKYNKFYGDPLCEGIEEFVLCQEIYDKDLDRETFEQRIKLYKDKKNQQDDTKTDIEEDKNQEDEIKEYIEKNKIEIIIISVFIVLIIITSIVSYKMIRKSRRLE